MTFWRRKRLFHDDDWAIDDDDWLSLEDNNGPKLIKIILAGVTAVILIVLAGQAIWSLWADRQTANQPPQAVQTLPPSTSFEISGLATATISTQPTSSPTGTLPATSTLPTVATPGQQLASSPDTYDPDMFAAIILEMVNTTRQENGLTAVAWDSTAALAGQLHAEEMAQADFFSHWNQEGLGPDHRYTLAGGQHAVMENLHAFSYTYEDGRAAPIENWPEVIQNAHAGLMNSPGHRANILDPAHTHVGIGMDYNPQTGQFRLAQEFTNQYTRLEQPLPRQAQPVDTITVRGQFVGNNLSNPLLQLAYEPFLQPMSLEELERTSTYSSTAVDVETRGVALAFDEVIRLNQATPGFYHVRLFVDVQGQQALVLDHVFEVR